MRLPYQCIYCGLRLAGKFGKDGRVYAYDKSPTAAEPPRPCVCVHCGELLKKDAP